MSMSMGPGGYNNITMAAHDNKLPLIQRIYGLLTVSVVFAVLCGMAVMHTPSVGTVNTANGPIAVPSGVVVASNFSFLVWIALFGMLFLARYIKSQGAGLLLVFAFTGLAGAWVTPSVFAALLRNNGDPSVIGLAGALTTVMFVTLTAYAMLSRTSFSFLGAGLNVAWIGLLAASLLNMFIFKSGFGFTVITWGILMFASVCVIYDTWRITRDPGLDERNYVLATLSLFVDLLNMFLAILSLLGGSRR